MHFLHTILDGAKGIVWGPSFLCFLFISFCGSRMTALKERPGEPDRITDDITYANWYVYILFYLCLYVFGLVINLLAGQSESLDSVWSHARSFACGAVVLIVIIPERRKSDISTMISALIYLSIPASAVYLAFLAAYIYFNQIGLSDVTTAAIESMIALALCVVGSVHFLAPQLTGVRAGYVVVIMEIVMNLVLTVLVMGVALGGFYFLHWFQAILWLLFWVWAYPVALAFTKAKAVKHMGEGKLIDMYKEGLTQIPVVGQFLGSVLRINKRPRNETAHEEREGARSPESSGGGAARNDNGDE